MRIFRLMTFNWSEEKNQRLKAERGISFEEIIIAIEEGFLVDVLQHHDFERYHNQRIYLVLYREYLWATPHVIDDEREEIFLKTIYPSRKFTKDYMSTRGH